MRFLLFLSLLAPQLCPAQSPVWPEQLTVTASALKLREKPGLDTKVLATLPQGAAVENLGVKTGDDQRWDVIDSIGAFWKHVRYNGQEGYVFGAYVVAPFQLLYENMPVEYLPKVKNWYGVYSTNQGDELRKIEVHTALDIAEMGSGDPEPFLRTNTTLESRFIIATNRDLKTGIIGNYYNRMHPGQEPGDTRFRYDFHPGSSLYLSAPNLPARTPDKAYELFGTGSFNLGENWIEQQNFKIWVTHKKGSGSQFSTKQDLTPFFYPYEYFCAIDWWGDLDSDGKADVLINRCSGGENGCRDYLFLSSEAKPGELLRPVALFFWGPGC